LQQLSEFAFKTIESDKFIFSDEDIESHPKLASCSKELQGLGLFKATELLSIKKMDNCIWYNFLHLSIHEFLAIFHLKSLKVCEQFEILKTTFFINHYVNVWVMFVGLQQTLTINFLQFSTYSHIYGKSKEAKDQMKFILQ